MKVIEFATDHYRNLDKPSLVRHWSLP